MYVRYVCVYRFLLVTCVDEVGRGWMGIVSFAVINFVDFIQKTKKEYDGTYSFIFSPVVHSPTFHSFLFKYNSMDRRN